MRSALHRFVRYEVSAPVTWAIGAVTTAVYLAQRLLGTWLVFPGFGGVDNVWHKFGFWRDSILHGEPWRLVTPNLIHTADWGKKYVPRGELHLVAVLVGLLVCGPLVERIYGHRRLAVIYITSGTAAYAVLLAVNPPNTFLMGGATGAVFGLAGAFLVYALRHGRERRELIRPAVMLFVVLAAVQYGWNASNPRILHVAGVAAGALLGLLLEPREGVRPSRPAQEPVQHEDLGLV